MLCENINADSFTAELFAFEEALAAAYCFVTTRKIEVEQRVVVPDGERFHIPFDGRKPSTKRHQQTTIKSVLS